MMQNSRPFSLNGLLRKTFKKIAVTSLALLVMFQAAAQFEKFQENYGPLADSLGKAYGIPPSLMLGVAIVESGGGKSRNAQLLNNFFGIKGKNNLMATKGIRSSYRQYPSPAASFVSFCELVSRKKFYPSLKGNPDYKLWTDALSHAGYSEIPEAWEKMINGAIRKHKLDKR